MAAEVTAMARVAAAGNVTVGCRTAAATEATVAPVRSTERAGPPGAAAAAEIAGATIATPGRAATATATVCACPAVAARRYAVAAATATSARTRRIAAIAAEEGSEIVTAGAITPAVVSAFAVRGAERRSAATALCESPPSPNEAEPPPPEPPPIYWPAPFCK
jgi:hypothetical protein